jgi:hypothetical protein
MQRNETKREELKLEEEPPLGNVVLAKCQALSEAAGGITKDL